MGTNFNIKYRQRTPISAQSKFISNLWFIFFLLNGCTAQQAIPSLYETDLEAIEAFNREYLAAINNEDIERLSALTTEEHIMLIPNRPPLVGKQANDEANRRAFELFEFDEEWHPVETEIAGYWAWQRGTYKVTATPHAGGDSLILEGSFLRIYRRQPDGSWRMIRDMFNSDQPATGITHRP
jgi:ketosteroid isomerase-like protein